MRGLLAQVYLLNDPFKNYPNFKLVHIENDAWINMINSQIDSDNLQFKLGEFAVINNGLQGPIKIWEAVLTGSEQVRQDFLDTDPAKYLNWTL